MVIFGKVKNGAIVLPPGADLPEGTEVRVETVDETPSETPIGRKLLALSGILKDMPEDLAENHDHYVHGTAKRSVHR